MDQLILSLLVIAVNALVTYFLLKRQEDRFAKSLFEHQVKFSQIHGKKVEALEGLYQKYVLFTEAAENVISDMKDAQTNGKVITDEDGERNKKNLSDKLHDFWLYFKTNRLFLPDEFTDRILEIYSYSELLQFIVGTQSTHFEQVANVPDYWWQPLHQIFKLRIESEEMARDPKYFLSKLSLLINHQSNTLERIYKSVTEIS